MKLRGMDSTLPQLEDSEELLLPTLEMKITLG